MTPGNWIQLLSIGTTLLLFMLPVVYFAGKIVGKIETLISRVTAMEGKLDSFQASCFTRADAEARMLATDTKHNAMWNKIDKMKRLMMKVFLKQEVSPADIADIE